MRLLSPTTGPERPVPTAAGTVVLLCDDAGRPGPALDLTRVAGALSEPAGAAVAVVPELCRRPERIGAYLGAGPFHRLVVGCAGSAAQGREALGYARRAGLDRSAVTLVGLDGHRHPTVDPEQDAVAVIQAGVARVAASEPLRPVTGGQRHLLRTPLSRRRLFGLTDKDARGAAAASQAAAAAGQLGRAAAQLGRGVVLVCADARTRPPLGSGWLGLEVASLETITTGWPLQLLAMGVPSVGYQTCSSVRCSVAARGTWDATRMMFEAVGLAGADRHLPADLSAVCLDVSSLPVGSGARSIGFVTDEPDATLGALRSLARPGPVAAVFHPSLPTARVVVDLSACTLCGACAAACPTGALCLVENDRSDRLLFGADRCRGFGSCVETCPHEALGLQRAFYAEVLGSAPAELAAVDRPRCPGCGGSMPPSVVTERVGVHLTGSHPELAAGLVRYCSECLLLQAGPRKESG